jgi:glutamate-1-semialdehyde 2,1-aminomutase
VAELLAEHYELPCWRFNNSGTEATRDAIHVARAYTGYDYIIKIECGYHGHHDSVMVSVNPSPDEQGPYEKPNSVPFQKGLPKVMTDLTLIIPFNCEASIIESRIQSVDGKVACIIIEPILMNCVIIMPKPEFLLSLRRICDKYGIVLIFDEVKTNTTVGRGGATRHFGVKPDMVCLGLPMSQYLNTEHT